MIKNLQRIIEKEKFKPTFLGIFINPFYIVRNGLYKSISQHRKYVIGKVLDFGCGNKPYEDMFENVSEYIGVDVEVSGHDHINSKIDIFYDGKKLPFQESSFDSVFSTEVFEHVFNIDEALLEINRVLKPGGYLIITFPFSWPEHEVPYDFARYTYYGMSDILTKKGFEIVVSEKTTNYVETLFQMLTVYILDSLFPKNILIKKAIAPFFIAPLNITGIILGMVLPKNFTFYHNNLIVAKKI